LSVLFSHYRSTLAEQLSARTRVFLWCVIPSIHCVSRLETGSSGETSRQRIGFLFRENCVFDDFHRCSARLPNAHTLRSAAARGAGVRVNDRQRSCVFVRHRCRRAVIRFSKSLKKATHRAVTFRG